MDAVPGKLCFRDEAARAGAGHERPEVRAVAARLTGSDDAPTVILVSSRDGSDFGPLVTRSGARGFVPKAELSGDRVQELLP